MGGPSGRRPSAAAVAWRRLKRPLTAGREWRIDIRTAGCSCRADRAASRLTVELSNEAEQDLLDGVRFYDRNGREVGSYFLQSIASDLRSLSILGGVHRKAYGYHRMTAKRFPFSIYYRVDGGVVRVMAILDERRSPESIAKRLRNR